jgi:HicB family/Nucleotidyltransferase domain
MNDTKRKSPRAETSGRFVLRLTPGLHATLRAAARDAGVSLNDYCARKLALPAGNPAALDSATAVVERAAELFGEDLIAVIAFGSWSRGEAMASSDVDVLIVVESSAPITRALYRRWDTRPLTWEAHAVEPHFVHLRGSEEGTTGLWAEAAIDGIMLFERGLAVSRRLAEIRREVLAGHLVRRTVHGQPYWSQVA